MIELLMMNQLIRAISRILQAKRRKPGWFQLLAVVLWIVGEIVGALIGIALEMEAGAYLLALLGAGGGALASYVIAKRALPGAPEPSAVVNVFE